MDAHTQMDEISALVACSQLVAKYPDISTTVMADVMQACGHSYSKAYYVLCEMVIPQQQDERAPLNELQAVTEGDDERDADVAPVTPRSPPAVIQRVQNDFYDTETASSATLSDNSPQSVHSDKIARQAAGRLRSDVQFPTSTQTVPEAAAPVLRGAWASKSIGRTYRIDQICNKYQWIQRSVVADLFRKYQDCVELVENDILMMFPVDEPAAFGGGFGHQPLDVLHSSALQTGYTQSPRREAMAESLREQAAAEIERNAIAANSAVLSSSSMETLRQQLWDARSERARIQQLANSTRKPSHIAEAKQKDRQLKRLSAYLLERIRNSEQYRNDCIDLHGLTKDEAITLVDWKLEDACGRKFRIITGRGTHSHNGRAVLRPALEKHFRSLGISFSQYADGIMTVTP